MSVPHLQESFCLWKLGLGLKLGLGWILCLINTCESTKKVMRGTMWTKPMDLVRFYYAVSCSAKGWWTMNKQKLCFNDKVQNMFKNLRRRFEYILAQRDMVANRHKERCSVSGVIREMQIKTRMKYNDIPRRMVKRKNTDNPKPGNDV